MSNSGEVTARELQGPTASPAQLPGPSARRLRPRPHGHVARPCVLCVLSRLGLAASHTSPWKAGTVPSQDPELASSLASADTVQHEAVIAPSPGAQAPPLPVCTGLPGNGHFHPQITVRVFNINHPSVGGEPPPDQVEPGKHCSIRELGQCPGIHCDHVPLPACLLLPSPRWPAIPDHKDSPARTAWRGPGHPGPSTRTPDDLTPHHQVPMARAPPPDLGPGACRGLARPVSLTHSQ